MTFSRSHIRVLGLEFEPKTVRDSPVRHLTTRTPLQSVQMCCHDFLKAKRRPGKSSTRFTVANWCYYFEGLHLVFASLGLWVMTSKQLWSCNLFHQRHLAELECSGGKTFVAVSRDEGEDHTWTISLNTAFLLLILSRKGGLVCHWRLTFRLSSAPACHGKLSWPFNAVLPFWGTEWYRKTSGKFSKRTTIVFFVQKPLWLCRLGAIIS